MYLQLTGATTFKSDIRYDCLYANATEDMSTYYKEFDYPKTFLSVGASGEQVVNAICAGAKVIDVYDSNRLCRHALSLRIAALQGLDKADLIEYFSTFSPLLFAKFAPLLPEDSLFYWYGIYSSFSLSQVGNIISIFLFSYKKLDIDLLESINPYLQGENYKKTQELSKDVTINYLDTDLYHLPQYIKEKTYDAMTFSNIYEYINFNDAVTREKAKQYRDFVINEMYPHLNEGGAIMVSYLYAWNEKVKEDFDKMHKEHPERLIGTGAILSSQINDYMAGHTTQNLSYSYLIDALCHDEIKMVPTQHVVFGQSKDMEHDMALILKK